MDAATQPETRRISGAEIRAKIEANRLKRLRIAEAMKAEAGVTDHEINERDLGGLAYIATGRIMSPEGRKIMELYTLAHECGHIFLHGIGTPGYHYPDHVKELEASLYAHQALAEYGMATPRIWTDWSRVYVGQWVTKDRAAGVRIDKQAEAYVNGTLSPFAPLREVPATWTKFTAASRRRSRKRSPRKFEQSATTQHVEPTLRTLETMPAEVQGLADYLWSWFCAGFTASLLVTLSGAIAWFWPELAAVLKTSSPGWREMFVAGVGGVLITNLAMMVRTLRTM